uniref:Gag-Pol polyprotein n=1 Tax=Tanacetum cinerariifolium TaxID=118510 RepID=A0A699K947_TANCI|nr:hypothetical protein [Tanacetum cinerariifolium]
MSDSDESGVTYTYVSSPFEELSDIGSPRADDHEHLELPEMLEDPYIEPYAEDASPTAQSPEYVPESDLEAHPEEDDDEDPEEDPVDYPTDRGDDGDDEEGSSEDDEDDDMDIEAVSLEKSNKNVIGWKEKFVLDSEGNPTTATEKVFETYKSVTQEIRDQLNAEAEAIQIILTRIDNDIYSTVDACLNACEMWKAIERLKQGESINVKDLETNLFWEFGKFTSLDGESLESYYSRFNKMMNELTRNQCNVTNHQVNVQFLLQLQPEWQRFVTLVKQSQELKNVLYHKLYDILKQHQHEVNEIRAKKIARVANPLALVAQQQQVYHPQTHPTQYNQTSLTRTP